MPEEKPTLLLLTCCGPCATACVERTAFDYDVTVFYYNPNITDSEEYYLRKENLEKFLRLFNEEYKDRTLVHYLEGRYEPEKYLGRTAMLKDEPEGGRRCEECFRIRYEEAARVAKARNADYWTSTMSVSPHKNYDLLTKTGEELAAESGTCYLPIDFKKKNGFGRSVELSKKYGLYRQRFCGCDYARYANAKRL
ncbi:epoxyqueuosine reductase QueH [Anaerovoracaceae bacterium Sow4_D4]|uniref:epoxyqueuosine reductase QueH n=1 Tax=Mogibacterium sp. TaxID=2049035 RepID=UPI00258EB16C|nr:epoxyqueuosine reductase QueH [Mogibacterium sp.]MCI7124166.1 epoxyqueuosine reductase QueH [Mogibacterium sp.]